MGRNSFSDGDWVLSKLGDLGCCECFTCGDSDIDEYFREDVVEHRAELISQTYYLYEVTQPDLILALLGFSNDTVRSKDIKGRVSTSAVKRYKSLPAVKLTRFGVSKQYQRMHIGTNALNLVKKFFTFDNRTGCRFVTVDAYNKPGIISFYKSNGFSFLTEKDLNKDNRAMYFDLLSFQAA